MPATLVISGPLLSVLAFAWAGHLFRYFVMAGTTDLVFYRLLPEWIQKGRRIGSRRASWADFKREALYSIQTTAIFAVIAVFVVWGSRQGFMKLYTDFDSRGAGYFWASLAGIFVFHDFFFYWIHRLMHVPGVYERVHLVHHKSVSPTPWTSFSFHPLESLLESLPVVVYLAVVPMHAKALLLFQFLSMAANIYAHFGQEWTPPWLERVFPFRYVLRSIDHHYHHDRFTGNYGFYFRIWDRIWGTYVQPEKAGLNAKARVSSSSF
ncbi:MAG: sterol desaturase family protein [Bdellovibrionales bacterium]|nr:sterol desaturase family protein [Bdellovibrionales bacterium]